MSSQLHHDLLNLVNSLSSVHFNVLMLTCKRGGTELREKTEKLCSEISLKGEVTEQTLETSVDIKNLLDRTRTDSELVASELERMEKTLEQLKPLITEVKSLIRSEKKPVAS